MILEIFFFFNDTATTEIYTLSLHDALPIYRVQRRVRLRHRDVQRPGAQRAGAHRLLGARLAGARPRDRKSTRLNSSHSQISYAVFCLKKKKHSHDQEELLNLLHTRPDIDVV